MTTIVHRLATRSRNRLPLYTVLAPGLSPETPWWQEELLPGLTPLGAKRRAKGEEEEEDEFDDSDDDDDYEDEEFDDDE